MSFLLYKKNHSFLMSPNVGDLFKSPAGSGAILSFKLFIGLKLLDFFFDAKNR